MIKPGLMVHFRANVPGTTVHMVHIPEYGTIGPWQKQKVHLGTKGIYFLTFSLHCMFGKTYTLSVIFSCTKALDIAEIVVQASNDQPRVLGARAKYDDTPTKPAEAAGESYHAEVAGPIPPLGIGQAK